MTHVRRGLAAAVLMGLALAGAPLLSPAPVFAVPALAADCLPAANVPYPAVPWAQRQLTPQRAWPFSQGDGVVVAIVDTGVSRLAPALAGRVLPGLDVRTGGRADSDCAGHGTFVAGLVAAGPMAGTGFVGLAPEALILPVRVADTFDDLPPDVLAEGIEASIDAGAAIIVVVPAAPSGSAALTRAVARAERENRLVVASSSTQRAGGTANPAAYASVLSVAAIGSDGEAMSTVGRDGTGRTPDIAAPGADVIGIAPAGVGSLAGSARSFATGFVAGAAALVWGYRPGLTAVQVRDRLVATADPAPPSLRPGIGAGMVDPVAAVTTVNPAVPGETGRVLAGPDPEVPVAPADVSADGMALAAGVVGAATVIVIIAGLAAASVSAARRRRADDST